MDKVDKAGRYQTGEEAEHGFDFWIRFYSLELRGPFLLWKDCANANIIEKYMGGAVMRRALRLPAILPAL